MDTKRHPTALTPRLGHYEIDARRSTVTFATRHLFGLAPVRGTFSIKAGTVDIAEPLTASRIHAEIDAGSFRTGLPPRDVTVRSARLLNARRHPLITFDAVGDDGFTRPAVTGPAVTGAAVTGAAVAGAAVADIEAGGVAGGALVTGQLTVRGVSRPVRLAVEPAEPAGDGDPAGSFTARALVRVDRAEFGITGFRGLAGRRLELVLVVRCVHQ
jgi:polyisoprenoid-binding protein YceI